MCAMLAKGHSLAESVKIANAAASIAIQHSLNGVPQCPDYDEAHRADRRIVDYR